MTGRVVFTLVSHTNVGKTTLLRTLLRRDVGEVLDQPHVTLENEEHVLLETEEGERLVLWDTPGFGDSVRLARLLETQDDPFSWLREQPWDRVRDTPLWCGQQAIANVLDEADLVLYLVNAAEDPDMAGYVGPEMTILDRIGKPVIALLNQTGAPSPAARRGEEEARWRKHLRPHLVVREVLGLDAFTRCWVQEGILLDHAAEALSGEDRTRLEKLRRVWRERNLEVFRRAMERLARLLATAAADREPVETTLVPQLGQARALARLVSRLRENVDEALADLLELHGLEGRAAASLRAELGDVSAPGEWSPWAIGGLGGLVSGALGGLAADLGSAGMSFGGGAVLGALLGAAGFGGLAWGLQAVLGVEDACYWTDGFLERQANEALLRYLAVAHSGRGSGAYREGEVPEFWREIVRDEAARREGMMRTLWTAARAREDVSERVAAVLRDCAAAALERLYPAAGSVIR